MSIIRDLLQVAVDKGASDIHLKPNHEPIYRINGVLTESDFDVLSPEDLEHIVADILPEPLHESYRATHEADFSLDEQDVARFRVNIFMAQGIPAIAMRHVKTHISNFEELNLPPQLAKIATIPRGIILLAGTTGAGKSTTLAAIINEINKQKRCRIITVEDPVEYLFEDEKSIITQREVGLDTMGYREALKYVMRQDPDVIMIGEMRDELSIATALLAAETGHLVLSTVHANTSSQAIPRMLDVFPAEERDKLRMAIAQNFHAVVCQRLIRATEGGLVPAVEIMINTSTVRKLITKNQLETLSAAIETGRDDDMQSFNQSIYDLIKSGRISERDGMRAATNPESLRMNLQGIFLDEGKRILAT